MNLKRLEREQIRLAKKVKLRNDLSEIRTIAGCDIAYTNDNIVCSFVVMDYPSLQVREVQTKESKTTFPYIPGFLAYREAPLIVETYHELELDPDIILVDGNGILHPRRFGLASAIGLLLDKPTIGVAKNLLLGDVFDGKVMDNEEKVGAVLETKQKAKPIYISPGHRVNWTRSIEVVKECQKEHKLPEPLHQAHKTANKVRRKLRGKDSQ